MLSVPANEVGDIVEANPESESGEVYDQFSPEWHSIWIDDLGGKEMVGCFGGPGRQERFSVRGERGCFESYAPELTRNCSTLPSRFLSNGFVAHGSQPALTSTCHVYGIPRHLNFSRYMRSDRGFKAVT